MQVVALARHVRTSRTRSGQTPAHAVANGWTTCVCARGGGVAGFLLVRRRG
jgi:hypothetical protein